MDNNKTLNESRKSNWLGADSELTLVKTQTGRKLIERADRYYDYDEVKEALVYEGYELKTVVADDIIAIIEDDLVDSEGCILNEVRYDWAHIDPRTGLPKIKEPRPEESIELMNRMPGRSGWIVFLHNRVNLNSVGNIRYAKKMWFDRATSKVAEDADSIETDGVHFRSYILPNAGRPGGWLDLDDYKRLTHRSI